MRVRGEPGCAPKLPPPPHSPVRAALTQAAAGGLRPGVAPNLGKRLLGARGCCLAGLPSVSVWRRRWCPGGRPSHPQRAGCPRRGPGWGQGPWALTACRAGVSLGQPRVSPGSLAWPRPAQNAAKNVPLCPDWGRGTQHPAGGCGCGGVSRCSSLRGLGTWVGGWCRLLRGAGRYRPDQRPRTPASGRPASAGRHGGAGGVAAPRVHPVASQGRPVVSAARAPAASRPSGPRRRGACVRVEGDV